MHPVLRAYLEWGEAVTLDVSPKSPVYAQWLHVCAYRRQWFLEIYRESGGK